MKVIKKITAIMLSIMMVLGMCSVVGAAETASGNYGDNNGTITINSAREGQDYTIYRMLKLESFSVPNYSYKAEDKWGNFVTTVTTNDGKNYFKVDNVNGYVEWNSEVADTDANKAELAKKALEYAKNSDNGVTTLKEYTKTADATGKVTYSNLPLGYYLVDSSMGALCGLTTTNKDAEITEKNGVPSVEKQIDIGENGTENLVKKNSVDLGETVIFKTTIDVAKGANNYILHDKMDSHLNFIQIAEVNDDKGRSYAENRDYTVEKNSEDNCTFELKFTESFYTTKADDTSKIFIYYLAKVKEDAPIKVAMKNNTWLTYGDKNTSSNKAETETYTYGIPVFKHTGTGENKQALAGAEFKLYTDSQCNDDNKALKFKKNASGVYRYDAASTNATLTSLDTGMINIEGIKEGTYYLKETAAPKGYNLLKDAKMIVIDKDGKITMDGTEVTQVDVQNNAGTILPSTGGIGTTIFYIAGAFLVLISGVVLIAKKRTDSK